MDAEKNQGELTVGLSAELQKVVDVLSEGGFEVRGIMPEGYINFEAGRPAYKVIVTKAVPKSYDSLKYSDSFLSGI